MKGKILIVEDNKTFSMLIMNRLSEENADELTLARTYKEASELLSNDNKFFLSLTDLHLPDSQDGEVVDLMTEHDIPVIVITSDISDKIQELIWSKRIIDYVIKEGPHTLDYIQKLITRIKRNSQIKILIVDDSQATRKYVKLLLEIHLYQVYEASSGTEALNILRENEDIKLVIVDYDMPEMDGIELIRNIRKKFSMDRLSIIGLSTYGNHKLSINFIKNGANDFITKPFFRDQLYCRITQNIEIIDHFDMIRELSNIDYLTRLNNRRYLGSVGEMLLNSAKRNGNTLVLALIDIDNFKNINDTFGHESGDLVLVNLASIFKQSFRNSDVVVRYGGDEFCILANNMNRNDSHRIFDSLRKKVEQMSIAHIDGKELYITVSIGICNELLETLNDMVNVADKKLYQVKKSGRNKVIV